MRDRRFVRRAVVPDGPRWPLALELARAGTPIGVALLPMFGGGLWIAAVVDTDGVLMEVRRLPESYLVRWCLNRHLRICHGVGDLVGSIQSGQVLGWVHGRIVEVKGGKSRPVLAQPLRVVVPGQPAEPGAAVIDSLELALHEA